MTHTQQLIMAREQLMNDIECIVESHIFEQWGSQYGDVSDELIRTLCDAVCKHIPGDNK